MASPPLRDAALLGALARRLDPRDPAAQTNLAWLAARSGALDDAFAAARRAAAIPGCPSAAWRTLERLAAGRTDGLLLVGGQSAAVSGPPARGSRLAAAIAAHRQGALVVAEACYQAELADDNELPAVWNGLAVLHEQRDERDAADAAWRHALRTPNAVNVHDCALAWMRRGLGADAQRFLEKYPSLMAVNATLLTLGGYIALVNDDPHGALPLLERAVRRDPHLARAHFTLGLVYDRLHRPDDALGATRRGLLLSPWFVPQVWLLDGLDEAAPVEIPAMGGERDASATDGVLLALGRSLLETAHLGEALAVFDQVLRRQPSHPAALFHRGVVLAKLRRYGEALDDWQQVQHVDPAGPLGAISQRHADSARRLADLFATG